MHIFAFPTRLVNIFENKITFNNLQWQNSTANVHRDDSLAPSYGLLPPVFRKNELYYVSKWRLCSKWPQKGCFFTITQSTLKNFMFSLLILVNGHIPHKS
jgi:hypothetical protein